MKQKYLTGNDPIAQNILLCNKETTNEEITSFLYRAILCNINTCFIIGGIESLNFIQKNHFLEILNKILFDKMESCLIILSIDKKTEIYKALELIKLKKDLPSKIEDELIEIKMDNIFNIKIISSDKSGTGKSTQIKKNILDRDKNYVYFPLGGVLNRKRIINRLKKLNLNENSAIHLDLCDTDNIDLMNHFLFSFLITRLYKVNEEIFYLPKKAEIHIEIPNGFISFKLKFPFLDLIPQKEEDIKSIESLDELIVPEELDSNIQIVSNYLKILKEIKETDKKENEENEEQKINKINKINDNNFYFPNITPKDLASIKKVTIPAEEISQKESQTLIFEIVEKQNKLPSYYQIKSLIDVLAFQFKKFNQSYFLNPYYLRKARYVRTFIIESFIEFSSYFTEGTFAKIINKQFINSRAIFGQYNENEDIKKGINELIDNYTNEKHNTMSFDKIDKSLIFFNEGTGQGFTIITQKDEKDKEYSILLDLKYGQDKKEEVKYLPNYKKYDKFGFLKELKEMLNLKETIPIKKEEKKTDEQISLEELTKNYAFTADNFVKMILILIRIRANIPVILMGETGCGKTSLIKKLYEILYYGSNSKLRILNIHAGTNDEDIIKFIDEINNEANILYIANNKDREFAKKEGMIYEEEKIWVFLDEINTCKSMGLISELMCKHSC